jgi:hypothetical protein
MLDPSVILKSGKRTSVVFVSKSPSSRAPPDGPILVGVCARLLATYAPSRGISSLRSGQRHSDGGRASLVTVDTRQGTRTFFFL